MREQCHGMVSWMFFLATVVLNPGIGTTSLVEAAGPVAAKVDFDREIRPLFSDRCFRCHGPNEKDRKGGFRLDQEKSALGRPSRVSIPLSRGTRNRVS